MLPTPPMRGWSSSARFTSVCRRRTAALNPALSKEASSGSIAMCASRGGMPPAGVSPPPPPPALSPPTAPPDGGLAQQSPLPLGVPPPPGRADPRLVEGGVERIDRDVREPGRDAAGGRLPRPATPGHLLDDQPAERPLVDEAQLPASVGE